MQGSNFRRGLNDYFPHYKCEQQFSFFPKYRVSTYDNLDPRGKFYTKASMQISFLKLQSE